MSINASASFADDSTTETFLPVPSSLSSTLSVQNTGDEQSFLAFQDIDVMPLTEDEKTTAGSGWFSHWFHKIEKIFTNHFNGQVFNFVPIATKFLL